MNEAWLKALILGCTFGAVLLAVEVFVGYLGRSRSAGNAINMRLRMIAEGHTREQTMSLLLCLLAALCWACCWGRSLSSFW